jgi:hypothetical protein
LEKQGLQVRRRLSLNDPVDISTALSQRNDAGKLTSPKMRPGVRVAALVGMIIAAALGADVFFLAVP